MQYRKRFQLCSKLSFAFLLSFTAVSAVALEAPGAGSEPACGAYRATVDGHLRSAYAATAADQMQSAIAELERDLQSAPAGCDLRSGILGEIAFLQFRVGDITDAEDSIRKARRLTPAAFSSDSNSAGALHFLLATVSCSRGDYGQAEREYKAAAAVLARRGKPQALALSRVYQDMALMYMRMHDLRSAERAMQKSLAVESSLPAVSPQALLVARDTIVHLRYQQGRVSEASELISDLVQTYGEDAAVDRHLRAHIRRDYGEMLLILHKPQLAEQQLQMSLALFDPRVDLASSAEVLSDVGQAYAMQDRFADAERVLGSAYAETKKFHGTFVDEAASISANYGRVLVKMRRWSDAQHVLEQALHLTHDGKLQLYTLKDLLLADKHLHDRSDLAGLRRQLRSLELAAAENPVQRDTVDVLAFAKH